MSYITEICIYGLDIKEPMEQVNAWIAGNNITGEIAPVNLENHHSGDRGFSMELFGGGFNYFPVDDFINFVKTVNFGMFSDQTVVMLTTETDPTIVIQFD